MTTAKQSTKYLSEKGLVTCRRLLVKNLTYVWGVGGTQEAIKRKIV